MPWLQGFRDKVVVVTGASSGIGRATALAFAAAGARVALVARRRHALEEVARLAGGETAVLPADVTRRTDVRAAFDGARARFGRVDVVVNNAGILLPAPVAEQSGRGLGAAGHGDPREARRARPGCRRPARGLGEGRVALARDGAPER